MKHLKLFESPDNISWLDDSIYYRRQEEYPFPFSICFNKDDEYEVDNYVGLIIGPMVGGHSLDVFSNLFSDQAITARGSHLEGAVFINEFDGKPIKFWFTVIGYVYIRRFCEETFYPFIKVEKFLPVKGV